MSSPNAAGPPGPHVERTSRRQKFSVSEVEDALRATDGIYTLAARLLDRKFPDRGGCSRVTISKMCQRFPRLRIARDEARAVLLDVVEGTVFSAARKGSLRAAIWILRTLGRERGYGDKLDIATPPGQALALGQRLKPDDLADMSTDELTRLVNGLIHGP